MEKERLTAFSDGVLAIIITIMVLEIKAPHGSDWSALFASLPIFLSYVLSFIYIGIYWNNHHHLLYTLRYVNGRILWANMNLLFWLSLVPVSTAWLGENRFAQNPTALYGFILLASAIAYYILQTIIINANGHDSPMAKIFGRDYKGKASVFLYILGIAFAFVSPWIALAIYVLVAFMWLIPDRRIERLFETITKD